MTQATTTADQIQALNAEIAGAAAALDTHVQVCPQCIANAVGQSHRVCDKIGPTWDAWFTARRTLRGLRQPMGIGA